jgi:hypothetical protein
MVKFWHGFCLNPLQRLSLVVGVSRLVEKSIAAKRPNRSAE